MQTRGGRYVARSVAALCAAIALTVAPLYSVSAPTKDVRRLSPCGGADLRSLGETWQRRLKLDPWEIAFLCMMPEEDQQTAFGRSGHREDYKIAIILVNPTSRDRYLVEKTIVHELVHVLMAYRKSVDPEEIEGEVLVMTDALMCAARPEGPDCVDQSEDFMEIVALLSNRFDLSREGPPPTKRDQAIRRQEPPRQAAATSSGASEQGSSLSGE